jgi:hypothetical protein
MCPDSSRREPFITTAKGVLGCPSPEKKIVIDLHDEPYRKLVVEVGDPEAAVKLIQNAV